MLKTIGAFAANASTFCLVGSAILLLWHHRQLSTLLRKFSYYVYWNLAIEIGAFVLMKMGVNNLPLLHLYTLGELLLWGVFYLEVLKLLPRQRKLLVITIAGAALLIVLNSIFLQDIQGFNSYAKTLVNTLLIGMSTLLLRQFLNDHIEADAERRATGLINSGVLFYYSSCLLIFMFSDYFFKHSSMYLGFWAFNSLSNLIFQIIIFTAVWIALGNKKLFYSSR